MALFASDFKPYNYQLIYEIFLAYNKEYNVYVGESS